MNHLDLFSGIGGFAYAVDQVWPGSTHTFCDNNKFCQKVLAKHWPESKIYGDIKDLIDKIETGIIEPCLSQDHVHIVNKNQEPLTRIGGRNVSPSQQKIDCTEAKKDTKNTNKELEKPRQNYENKSLKRMGGSVSVAGKMKHHFLPLTTLTEVEQRKEKRLWGCNSTEELEKKDSPININYSVTTAIMESIGLEYAHTRTIDIVTGGFPCQSFSQAGKRLGTADPRWLWPQMFRIIQLTKPKFVLAENVRGLVNWQGGVAFRQVLSDLESEGYNTQSFIIPACAVNAPHRRDRVWIVANRNNQGLQGHRSKHELREDCQEIKATWKDWDKPWLEIAAWYGRMDDGLRAWLDRCFQSIVYEEDYAASIKENQRETLSLLRKTLLQEKVWEELGRLYKVEQAEILLNLVCRIQEESNRQNHLPHEGEKIQKGSMRNLRDGWEARRSPRRREYQKQLSRKLEDILPSLSHEVSLEIASCWDYLWVAYSSMNPKNNRVDRLKSLGNAIVPQVAIQIMKAINLAPYLLNN